LISENLTLICLLFGRSVEAIVEICVRVSLNDEIFFRSLRADDSGGSTLRVLLTVLIKLGKSHPVIDRRGRVVKFKCGPWEFSPELNSEVDGLLVTISDDSI